MATKARIDIIGRDKTKAAFRSAEGSLKRFRSAALGIGAVLSTGLFVRATKGAVDFADGIDKAAKAAGVSAEFLQEMRFAGEQLGVSTKLVDEGFRRFGRRLGVFATDQTGPAAKAIKRLGIDINDMKGNFRGSEAIFKDFVVQMQQFESFAKQSSTAAEIFGDDAGPKLALLVAQGTDGLAKLSQEARDIGAVMTNDVIATAVEAKDSMAKLSSVLQVQLSTAFINLAPLLTAAADKMVSLTTAWREFFNIVGGSSAISLAQDRISDLNTKADVLRTRLESPLSKLFGQRDEIRLQLSSIQDEIFALDDAIVALDKRQVKVNIKAELDQSNAQADYDKLIKKEQLEKDVEGILARLNPLQAAAAKFNDEVKKIELSDLGMDEKIIAIHQLGQEFDAAYGSAKTFADSTKEFEALQDRLFPLQAAVKDFNRELALIKRNTIAGPEQDEAIRRLEEGFSKATGASRKLQKENKALSDGAVDMGFAFSSAFEDAVIDGEKFGDVLDGLLKDIQRVALRTAITQPLGQAVGAGISQTFPAFASGTNFAPGGLAVVGERGPELVDLPRGSRVLPNGAGGTTVNVINNSGESANVRRSNDGNGRELINVIIGQVAQNITSGGQVAQSMQSVFGVRRQGTLRT